MNTLGEYFRDSKQQMLIGDWNKTQIATLEPKLKKLSKLLLGKSVKRGGSNQSIGNRYQKLVESLFEYGNIPGTEHVTVSASGYPDVALRVGKESFTVALEVKATSNWDPTDSNRRVLMSSFRRLKAISGKFPNDPILHLLCTVEYNKTMVIEKVRYHFLGPKSKINYRQEASVSHRILEGDKMPKLIHSKM